MITTGQKIAYLANSILRYAEPKICPYCASSHTHEIDRKYLVTRLLECQHCHLYFRHPYETQASNRSFYQKAYTEKDKLTTDLPSPEGLEALKAINFKTDSNKHAARLIRLFQCLYPSVNALNIIDYGASWGYISYQFLQAGMSVQSFEISAPRAQYGNDNLGLDIKTRVEDLTPGADIFFSSHVIEHVPSISAMLDQAIKLIRPGGYFIALCPNGSDGFRLSNPSGFHQAWGKVHPNYLNDKFFRHVFKSQPHYIGSSPIHFDAISAWNGLGQYTDNLDGEELLLIAKIA